jgi:4-hydroxybenzoate polyprenyltransferase
MRPANIVTAVADILAGVAIAGSLLSLSLGRITEKNIPLSELLIQNQSFGPYVTIILLMLSTSCLYGGGVVLNDVFDADLDKLERPERPIPSGLIKKTSATAFGILLLVIGIIAAAFANPESYFSITTLIAIVIALAAVVYDKWMKHHALLGPITMGLCRGCNLLLGMSIEQLAIQYFWFIALVPVIYIAAITMISRGEVHGGKRITLYVAASLYILVVLAVLVVGVYENTLAITLPFVALFSFLIFTPLQKAIIKPEGARIGRAVKSGVLSLIVMDASWAAAFGDVYFAIIILLLLPLSLLLARIFAVT